MRLLAVATAAALYALQAFAVDGLQIQLGKIGGADWSAQAVTLEIGWQQEEKSRFRLAGEQLQHRALASPLKRFALECSEGSFSDREISCHKGILYLNHAAMQNPEIPVRFRWDRETESLELHSDQIRLKGGTLRFDLNSDTEGWSLQMASDAFNLERLAGLLGPSLPQLIEMEISGSSRISLEMKGREEQLNALHLSTRFRNLAFADGAYEYLGEELLGEWSFSARRSGARWQGKQKLLLRQGALLTPYFYLAPEKKPITLGFQFNADKQLHRLAIENLKYRHPQLLDLEASVVLAPAASPAVQKLKLKTNQIDLPLFYEAYIQPIAAETLFDGMELSGTAGLELETASGGLNRVKLEIKDLYLEQGEKLFAVYGVNGNLTSTTEPDGKPGTLSWEGGHVLGTIDIGAASAALRVHGETLQLAESLHLPVFDGAIEVQEFSIKRRETGPQVKFKGFVTPISMGDVSSAFGWPRLAGQLSGVIPGVAYEKGSITLDGSMLVKVFDGDIVIRKLHLEKLFSALPRMRADLEMKNLDLEILTRTFSFGKITGKLEGEIKELYLEQWRPVSFDAWFATPKDDKSRHRISQRAVENISDLGGAGVSGAVSRTFLRLFKEFGYSRLGIRCRLKNGVCAMGGIEPAKEGYYLVKGGGMIPHIDVIGFNRQIDWDVLLGQLLEISRQEMSASEEEE
jgi:opacity protein-like surface antigen